MLGDRVLQSLEAKWPGLKFYFSIYCKFLHFFEFQFSSLWYEKNSKDLIELLVGLYIIKDTKIWRGGCPVVWAH